MARYISILFLATLLIATQADVASSTLAKSVRRVTSSQKRRHLEGTMPDPDEECDSAIACNDQGTAELDRDGNCVCTCNEGYHGDACQFEPCVAPEVYNDDAGACMVPCDAAYHCNGRGSTSGYEDEEGECACACFEGFIGDECQLADCESAEIACNGRGFITNQAVNCDCTCTSNRFKNPDGSPGSSDCSKMVSASLGLCNPSRANNRANRFCSKTDGTSHPDGACTHPERFPANRPRPQCIEVTGDCHGYSGFCFPSHV